MKVLLVDDERLALNHLEKRLLKIGQVEVVGKLIDPRMAFKHIEEEQVDVVFLDIQMPEMNGIELAEQLASMKPELNIVFVTAYDHFAVKAFELNALDYVVKPVSMDRLSKTIQRIQSLLGKKKEEQVAADRPIRLNLFKSVVVESTDGQMQTIQWRTAKAQELFLYILQHRGQLVRKSILIEMLWPEFEPAKAYSQLYTTVYHIRKTLSAFGNRFHIANNLEGYVLHINDVSLDIDKWEQFVAACTAISPNNIDSYKEHMKLYEGDYLDTYDYWWAEPERQRLKLLWLQSASKLAEWYEQQQRIGEAAACLEEICSRSPLDESYYFALMKLYASVGNHVSVNRQYRLLCQVLMEELNERPSAYITDWFESWNAIARP